MESTLAQTKHRSPQFSQAFQLVTIDLDDQDEVSELIEQRKVCGWSYEMDDIRYWQGQIARGAKLMWWIVVRSAEPEVVTTTTNAGEDILQQQQQQHPPGRRAGHVALGSESTPPDRDLARADRSILTVSSFFIMPDYRATGLGRATWQELENRARQIPECQQIAIETWDARYTREDDPEWGGWLKKIGYGVERPFTNEEWFARMGYEKFKAVPRYPLPGTDKLMGAVYMRKWLK